MTKTFDSWRHTGPLEPDEKSALDRFLQSYPRPLLAFRELGRFKYRFEQNLDDVHGVADLIRYIERLRERIREVDEDGETRSAEISELMFVMAENGRDEAAFREVADCVTRQVRLLDHPADRAFTLGSALLANRGWIRVRHHTWALTTWAFLEMPALSDAPPEALASTAHPLLEVLHQPACRHPHRGAAASAALGQKEEQ